MTSAWYAFRAWLKVGPQGTALNLLVVAKSTDAAGAAARRLAAKTERPVVFVGLESLGRIDAWEGPPPGSRLEPQPPEAPRVIT